MPGHWNTVSVMIAKGDQRAELQPVMVITGTSVFFSAWPKCTTRSGGPRART